MKEDIKEFIQYELKTYKEKHTLEKRCGQIVNILSVFGIDTGSIYITSYSNPYLFRISSEINSVEAVIEANSALIKLEEGKILYNFITSRYIEC